MASLAEHPPLLLPAPRKVVFLSGTVTAPQPLTVAGVTGEECALVLGRLWPARVTESAQAFVHTEVRPGSGPAESYRLTLTPGPAGGKSPGRAEVTAADAAGLHHGLRTLAQLCVQYGARLPALDIDDAPAFAVRGVMLDISRDRVPRLSELLSYVDQFAAWKFNHLQLYTEHTFAYAGHEEVWKDASPLTPDEVRELDACCRARGIVLAANQNCFGHLVPWLSRPRYAPLAEAPKGWHWGTHFRPEPFSLCPGDPGSIRLIEDLLGQLLPCFSSGLVNINCDETIDVGQGRSKEAVAARGFAAVYLEFLGKIVACVRRHGFRPMFWADMALAHPECLPQIPPELIALAWGYEPSTPFAEWCGQLRAAGREVWVCPGTSSWTTFTGRTDERRGNLAAAARGAEAGAAGFLVTDWGDAGHRQQWPIALHALAEAAHVAWHGPDLAAGAGKTGFDARAASLHAFGDHSLTLGPWLDELGNADRDLRLIAGRPGPDGKPRPLGNGTALHKDLQVHAPGAFLAGTPAEWRAVQQRLERLADRLPQGLSAQVQSELKLTLDVSRLSAERAALRRQPGALTRPAARRLATQLRALTEEHRRLWLLRSRPGGLAASCRHYEAVAEELDRL